jgi:hypothetical protein
MSRLEFRARAQEPLLKGAYSALAQAPDETMTSELDQASTLE